MKIQVAKWGNSLALRIPAEVARSVGLKEGDHLEARLTVDGALTLRRPVIWNRKAFAKTLTVARATMSVGESVMDELRRG